MGEHELEEILALERGVWEALMSGDAAADTRLLSHDFLGVYKTGFAGREAHAGMLDNGPTVESYTLSEPRLRVLSASVVLLCYVADHVRIPGDGRTSRMYVSSIWEKTGGEWLNIFSQDTDAAP